MLLVLTSAILFFFKLDATLLTNWDEAWHAVIARNMARTGDFVTPTYNGQIWFSTAPLYLWLIAIWFKFIGISAFGVRIFSALAGVGTVILTYHIGKLLFSHRVGMIAGLVLITTVQFLYRGRTGNLDTTLTFFITLAVYAFLAGKKNHLWYLVTGASTALAFLSKGILGLLPLPLLLMVPQKYIYRTTVSFLLVFLPWHLLAYSRHGETFINYYFRDYMFSKASVPNPVSGTEIFWYITALRHGLKIWFITFPLALILGLKDSFKNKKLRLPLAWIIIPFILLTLARMRNDWYLMFIYPAIALLIGYFLGKSSTRWLNETAIVLGVAVFGLLNITVYRNAIIVPETVAAEAVLSTRVKDETRQDESILLDDNYLPVAAFYADRQIIPLRFSRELGALVPPEALTEATHGALTKLVLTNTETFDQLMGAFNYPESMLLEKIDDKLLIRLKF